MTDVCSVILICLLYFNAKIIGDRQQKFLSLTKKTIPFDDRLSSNPLPVCNGVARRADGRAERSRIRLEVADQFIHSYEN